METLFAASSGWLHCIAGCWGLWIWVWAFFVLLLVAFAEVGPLLSTLLFWCCFEVFDGVSFFSLVICVFCLFLPFPIRPTIPLLLSWPCVSLWVCAWCLSQLPLTVLHSVLSPSPPTPPSPANGPPSPKFGRDPLSYCLKEINKTVKPRISSFRTLKRTVSVIGQGSSKLIKPVHCCLFKVFSSTDLGLRSGHNEVEITSLSLLIFSHNNTSSSPIPATHLRLVSQLANAPEVLWQTKRTASYVSLSFSCILVSCIGSKST